MSEKSAYLNGQWVGQDELLIPIDDPGFAMGATVVERMRTFRGNVFRLEQHLERLRRSLEIVGVDPEPVCERFADIVPECVVRSKTDLDVADDLYVVTIVTPQYDSPQPNTMAVYSRPLPFGNWARQYSEGADAIISDVRQVPANCWPPELKCRSRMHYYLGGRSAGPQRALLLDQEGYVGEGTTSNVLIYNSNKGNSNKGLVSPPRERILPGVTLSVCEEISAKLKIPFSEQLFTPDMLRTADEVFLVSTSLCMLPVVTCDDTPIGDGAPGPVYRQMLDAWNKVAGLDVAEQARAFSVR